VRIGAVRVGAVRIGAVRIGGSPRGGGARTDGAGGAGRVIAVPLSLSSPSVVLPLSSPVLFALWSPFMNVHSTLFSVYSSM
jgi:hypothetical protein